MTWLHLIQEGIVLLFSIGASTWFYCRVYLWWRRKQSEMDFRVVVVSGLIAVLSYLAVLSHMIPDTQK